MGQIILLYRQCTRKKRALKRIFKKWKKGMIKREKLIEEKNLRELQERKQREEGSRRRKIEEIEKGN